MNKAVTAFLLTGSNLGNRELNISSAFQNIKETEGTKIVKSSSIYETEAWGFKEQPSFLNQVIEIETILPAQELLNAMLKIEINMGRIRIEKWSSRIIDIDLLLYGDEIIETALLSVPHPQLHNRKFTLLPLAEIAGELIHPVLLISINELLHICTDSSEVNVYRKHNS